MNQKIHVFGHRNPDADSICSAIAYADFKNKMGFDNVFPGRLGPVNKETQFILDQFEVAAPDLIKDVSPQVSDLILNHFSTVSESDSLSEAMDRILNNPGRSVPVVDGQKKLIGILSLPDIIPAFTDSFSKTVLKDNRTPFKNIIELLDARVLGHLESPIVTGSVYTITEIKEGQYLNSDDILVTVETEEYIKRALATEAGIIIIANALADQVIPLDDEIFTASKKSCLIVSLGPFEVIRRLSQGIPIRNFYQHKHLEYFMTYETIDDVKKNMLSSNHERFPVVNEEGEVVSIISRSHLVDFNRKKVILVDHNERSQSILGIEEAEIVEIIDHHRIADVQTSSPLYLRIEPVGCTSTIITKMYREQEIPIPKKIAGLMLSAIISDTLLFNSPTCTQEDQEMASYLASLINIDIKHYGKKMLIAGSNLDTMTPTEIIQTDLKIFTMGKYKIAVSQINTGDFRGIYKKLDAVLNEMNQFCDQQALSLSVLMVTDIVLGGTELIIAGKEKNLARLAFDFQSSEFSKFLNGVFSRKKQIVPPLMNAASF